MSKTVYLLLIIMLCWSCSSNSSTEKRQGKRDNVINVHDQIKEIVIEDVLIHSYAWVKIIDNYLFIQDFKSVDEHIHIFDKNNFKYITSTALKGQGPGEIAHIGYTAEDKINRKFYVSDNGKYKIYSYDLDSVVNDPTYLPIEKMTMSEQLFPSEYIYINDTLCIGQFIEPIGSSDFKPVVGKFNMNTGEMKVINNTFHPDIKKKRINFNISFEHGIYVECHWRYDLMAIYNLDGELKYNIYGPDWDADTNVMNHYGTVIFCNDRIVTDYSGEKDKKDGGNISYTKFMVFDLEGNYLKTLETGYRIGKFCYDKDNDRIIMSMNDDIQFGYLQLNGLLD